MKLATILIIVAALEWGNGSAIYKERARYYSPTSDFITHLPGVETAPNFNMFSGYLYAGQNKYLHYWYVAFIYLFVTINRKINCIPIIYYFFCYRTNLVHKL